MSKSKSKLKLFAPVVAVLALAACTNESGEGEGDGGEPQEQASEIATASASAEANTIDLSCPEPVGTVQVTQDSEDNWAPFYVVGSDAVLDPVAYGEVVFTNAATGQTTTTSPVTKEGADATGAVECSFEDEVSEEDARGMVTGTVQVKQRTE